MANLNNKNDKITSICFYFQVHQPFRLRKNYDFFSIAKNHNYQDHKQNQKIMERISKNCYLPTNKLLLKLINKMKGQFKVSFSISGLALEQFILHAPEVLDSFKKLVDTGHVELIGETYYHSLAFIKSKKEFIEQVKIHKHKLKDLFGITPLTFRNTELIYNNQVAQTVENMGYKTILSVRAKNILGKYSPNYLYRPYGCKKLHLLLKNHQLSDDIAFRFSNINSALYPLTAKKYANLIHMLEEKANIINLFIDYETFGEHHAEKTGIFKFLSQLPYKILENTKFKFITPCEAQDLYETKGIIDCPSFVSWADQSQDLSAWLDNPLQYAAFDYLYSLEKKVKDINDKDLLDTWRKLTCSDHLYYISKKTGNDGAVHNYFSPYDSPHDAFIIYSNVLNDLQLTLKEMDNKS